MFQFYTLIKDFEVWKWNIVVKSLNSSSANPEKGQTNDFGILWDDYNDEFISNLIGVLEE